MTRLILSLALLVACASAFAEPMMPAPISALFFLFLTPPGWIILGALAVAVVVAIVKALKSDD